MRIHPAAYVALLAACQAQAPDYEDMNEPLESMPHWCVEERPAYLAVSDELDPECIETILDALDFWKTQGVTYLNPLTVPNRQLTPGQPWPRYIQVTTDPPEHDYSAADTRLHRLSHECLDGAEIRIALCRKQTIAHEIGHALGLPHVDDMGNLMAKAAVSSIDGPYKLTAEQLEHVR